MELSGRTRAGNDLCRGWEHWTDPCPKCAETVRMAAVVCKHCGSELSPISEQPGNSSYKALAKAAEEAG